MTADARHGGDRDAVRAAGTCGGGMRSELKLKADDGAIESEFEVHQARGGSAWRVVVAQEGRIVWRATVRAGRSSGAFTLERRLRDFAGADRVSIRASGPRGITCRASDAGRRLRFGTDRRRPWGRRARQTATCHLGDRAGAAVSTGTADGEIGGSCLCRGVEPLRMLQRPGRRIAV